MEYNFDDIRNSHLAENFALTYGGTNEIEKARQADPIGTIKQMGGREVIKTANGWRAHTKGSASKTKEHLEKNPSANHKDEHLEKFSKETPEAELKRVIKESTDPRLREHANKELERRKRTETGDKKMSFIDVLNDPKGKRLVEAIEDMGDNPDLAGEKKTAIKELKDKFGYVYKTSDDDKAGDKDKGRTETKDAHEKRGFDEKKGDKDVTGKSEKIPKVVTNKSEIKKVVDGIINEKSYHGLGFLTDSDRKPYKVEVTTKEIDGKSFPIFHIGYNGKKGSLFDYEKGKSSHEKKLEEALKDKGYKVGEAHGVWRTLEKL